MAKVKGTKSSGNEKILLNQLNKKRTSVGNGFHCKPNNKHSRKNWKQYRGQGK